jgi:Tol biopolymer transport system component
VGVPRRITTGSQASWSRDGKWIYFTSNRSGEAQIWKIPVEQGQATGKPFQITKKGGVRAQEAPNGDLLYYAKSDRSGIWKASTGGGEEILVLDREIDYRDWCVADGSIYFYNSKSLQRLELESGEITTVLERERLMRNLTVSPDGEWLVWDEQGEVDMQLVLLENFQ